MQPLQTTSSSVPLTLRDSFVTDPFFQAARQTLERCLCDLYEAHQKHLNLKEGSLALCFCRCAQNQAFQRLGNWMPAVLIPCLHCLSKQVSLNQQGISSLVTDLPAQKQNESREVNELVRLQDTALHLPAGQLSVNNARFELILDVHGFLPQELQVNVKDNCVEVNARHIESDLISSQTIVKRYMLPCCVDTEMVQCSLSKDGILLVTAPWKP